VNFRHKEGHHFEFQIWVFQNFENKKRPQPLVSCRPPAWALRRSLACLLLSPATATELSPSTLLCLLPHSSVPSAEHRRWEPLLPPCAPPCRHRLGVHSLNRPLLRADRTPPLTSFPSDQSAPPAAKDLHNVSPRRSSSGLISAVLSTARTPDSFLTQQLAPNDRRSSPPRHSPPTDHTSPWSSFFR
jgi:hypothetical protein